MRDTLLIITALLCLAVVATASGSNVIPRYSGHRMELKQSTSGVALPMSVEVTIKEFMPFVFLNTTTGRPQGFTIDLWEEIARRLGIATNYRPVDGFTALIGSVTTGTADIGLTGSTVTRQREEIVDFSHIYYESGLRIVQRLDDLEASFMASLFSPLFIQILAVTAAVLVIVGHLMWLFERSANSDFRPSYPVGAWDGIWWATVTISTVGYGDVKPRTSLGRFLAILWMLFGLVSTTLLLSVVVSSLTQLQRRGEFKSVSDLYGKQVGVVANTTSYDYVESRLGGGKIVSYPDSIVGMQALERSEVDAFVFDDPVVIRHSKVLFPDTLTPVGSVFDPQPYGLMMRKGSPLLQRVNAELIDIRASALYIELLERWSLKQDDGDEELRSLTQSATLLIVSLIVLAVVVFSVCVFGTYYTYQRRKHKNDLSQWAEQRINIVSYIEECKAEYPMLDSYGHIRLTMGGRHMPKMDTFGKSDPYVTVLAPDILYKRGYVAVAQTEPHFYTRNPEWKRLTIPTFVLTGGTLDTKVRFLISDFNSMEKDETIGIVETTVRAVLSGQDTFILNEGKADKKQVLNKPPELQVYKATLCTPPELPKTGLRRRGSFLGNEQDSNDTSKLIESLQSVRHLLRTVEDQLNRIEHRAFALSTSDEADGQRELFSRDRRSQPALTAAHVSPISGLNSDDDDDFGSPPYIRRTSTRQGGESSDDMKRYRWEPSFLNSTDRARDVNRGVRARSPEIEPGPARPPGRRPWDE